MGDIHSMTAEQALREVDFFLDGDNLRCSAPKGSVTPELRRTIAEHRGEIIAAIRRKEALGRRLNDLPRIPWAVRQCEGCGLLYGFRCRHADGPGTERPDGHGCERFEADE